MGNWEIDLYRRHPELAQSTGIFIPEDLDTPAQKCINAIAPDLKAKRIKPCEAFARSMKCLAKAVVDSRPKDPSTGEFVVKDGNHWFRREGIYVFLHLAWAYLLDESDRENYAVCGFVSRRAPAENYTPAPEIDAFTGHMDAGKGTGYIQPFPDDPDQDASGRKAHLIANALIQRWWILGDLARAVYNATETSTTDIAVNNLGKKLYQGLSSGEITPDNIDDWLRNNLCTEAPPPPSPPPNADPLQESGSPSSPRRAPVLGPTNIQPMRP